MAIYLAYIGMGALFALIIAVLPPVWKLWGWRVVAWPMYSAWGISCVVTGMWWFYGWPIEIWWKLVLLFNVCFPLIIIGAQLNYWLRQEKGE